MNTKIDKKLPQEHMNQIRNQAIKAYKTVFPEEGEFGTEYSHAISIIDSDEAHKGNAVKNNA